MKRGLRYFKKSWMYYFFWFSIILFISTRMPLFSDDIGHSKSLVDGRVITNLNQIIPSVMIYYNTWGGRALSMVLIQTMLMLPKWVFNVTNALVYILIIRTVIGYVECSLSHVETAIFARKKGIIISFLFVFMWFFEPDFDDVITWLTGSISYMWMNLLVLNFGLLYYKHFAKSEVVEPNLSVTHIIACSTGYFILGLAAGLSIEPSACALGLGIFLFVLWELVEKKRIFIYEWTGIIGLLLGMTLLLLAPGNGVRSGYVKKVSETGSFFQVYGHRFLRESFYFALFLLVPLAISFALYLFKRSTEISLNAIWSDLKKGNEPFFYLIAIASVYVMTFSSGFANRIFQFPFIMLMIASAKSFTVLVEGIDVEKESKFLCGIKVFLMLMMIMALVEVITGTLYSMQSGTWFTRSMFYYRLDDPSTADLLPGNGIVK